MQSVLIKLAIAAALAIGTGGYGYIKGRNDGYAASERKHEKARLAAEAERQRIEKVARVQAQEDDESDAKIERGNDETAGNFPPAATGACSVNGRWLYNDLARLR